MNGETWFFDCDHPVWSLGLWDIRITKEGWFQVFLDSEYQKTFSNLESAQEWCESWEQ